MCSQPRYLLLVHCVCLCMMKRISAIEKQLEWPTYLRRCRCTIELVYKSINLTTEHNKAAVATDADANAVLAAAMAN